MALNLGATDFVPSWLKKPAAPKPAAAAPAPAPTPAPATAAPSASTTMATTTTTTSTRSPAGGVAPKRMNAEAEVFIPKTPIIAAKGGSAAVPAIGQASKALLEGKTESDLLAILKNSSLKVNAVSFVPAHPSRKFREAMALTPLALTPIVDDPDLLLADTWCLYFMPCPVSKEEEFDPALVFRIDSVASFWKTFNNLPPANEIPARSAMYLFRDDIIPKWEDVKNRDGGLYRVTVPTTKANDVWLRTAAKTIGESWRKNHRNSVNGIVLKMRERAMYIEVWVSQEMENFIADWFDEFKSVMPSAAIDWYSHAQLQEIHREAAKNAAANASKKKRR